MRLGKKRSSRRSASAQVMSRASSSGRSCARAATFPTEKPHFDAAYVRISEICAAIVCAAPTGDWLSMTRELENTTSAPPEPAPAIVHCWRKTRRFIFDHGPAHTTSCTRSSPRPWRSVMESTSPLKTQTHDPEPLYSTVTVSPDWRSPAGTDCATNVSVSRFANLRRDPAPGKNSASAAPLRLRVKRNWRVLRPGMAMLSAAVIIPPARLPGSGRGGYWRS